MARRTRSIQCVHALGIGVYVFFGFLRTGEIVVSSDAEYDRTVHLSVDDVLVDNVVTPQWLEIRIKASRTDPFRKGSRCTSVLQV